MEQEFQPVAVKREPSVEYLLILPPAEDDEPGSQPEEDDTPMQGNFDGCQASQEVVEECQESHSRAGIMEVEVEQELVAVKREPLVEFLFILPPASNPKPAPRAEAPKVVRPKRARLGRPKKLASSSNLFKCNGCSYQTKVKGNLTTHKRTHNKSVECVTCEKKFSRSDSLKVHQMQHKHGVYTTAPEETFDCDKCEKSFSSSKYLSAHRGSVHDENEVKCEVCNKICKNPNSLRDHRRIHVKEECSICHKKVSKHSMAHHMRAHSADNSFMCDLCDYSTNRKGSLKEHIKRMHLLRKLVDDSKSRDEFDDFELLDKLQLKHGSSATSSEKNFRCGECGKSYVTQTGLRQHKKEVHTEATFECEVCQKAFKTKGCLNEHNANIHLKVSCSICNKKIGQRSLKTHMKLHLRGSFECDICGYKSKQMKWLANHINNKHRNGLSKARKRSSRTTKK